MQSNNWRVIKDGSLRSGEGGLIGIVRENACPPDEFFWASQHPFFGLKGNRHDDIAVPHDVIRQVSGKTVTLTITRDEFLALPQRWQIERAKTHPDGPQTPVERFMDGFRQGQMMGTPAWRPMVGSEPHVEPAENKPRTVLSAYEAAIEEMASVERMREEMIAQHGKLSPEMEELFGEYRKAVRIRAQAQFEREASELMGTAVHHGH